MTQWISFDEIKENRDGYFIHYIPASGRLRFATLQLIFIKKIGLQIIRNLMILEAKKWIDRYPIPLMVTSSDIKDDVIYVNGTSHESHLIAWYDPKKNKTVKHWKLLSDDQIPDVALDLNYLKDIYHDLPYKTSEEIKIKSNIKTKERVRANRFTVFILIMWISVIPASITIGGFVNPFISITALIYSIYKALTQALKLLGYRKKTIKEREKNEEERDQLQLLGSNG